MTKSQEKYIQYWIKIFRRDVRSGAVSIEELPEHIAGVWEQKAEYRINENEPKKVTFPQFKAGIMAAFKSAHTKKAPSRKKAPKKKSTLQSVAFSAGRGARHFFNFLGRKV